MTLTVPRLLFGPAMGLTAVDVGHGRRAFPHRHRRLWPPWAVVAGAFRRRAFASTGASRPGAGGDADGSEFSLRLFRSRQRIQLFSSHRRGTAYRSLPGRRGSRAGLRLVSHDAGDAGSSHPQRAAFPGLQSGSAADRVVDGDARLGWPGGKSLSFLSRRCRRRADRDRDMDTGSVAGRQIALYAARRGRKSSDAFGHDAIWPSESLVALEHKGLGYDLRRAICAA